MFLEFEFLSCSGLVNQFEKSPNTSLFSLSSLPTFSSLSLSSPLSPRRSAAVQPSLVELPPPMDLSLSPLSTATHQLARHHLSRPIETRTLNPQNPNSGRIFSFPVSLCFVKVCSSLPSSFSVFLELRFPNIEP